MLCRTSRASTASRVAEEETVDRLLSGKTKHFKLRSFRDGNLDPEGIEQLAAAELSVGHRPLPLPLKVNRLTNSFVEAYRADKYGAAGGGRSSAKQTLVHKVRRLQKETKLLRREIKYKKTGEFDNSELVSGVGPLFSGTRALHRDAHDVMATRARIQNGEAHVLNLPSAAAPQKPPQRGKARSVARPSTTEVGGLAGTMFAESRMLAKMETMGETTTAAFQRDASSVRGIPDTQRFRQVEQWEERGFHPLVDPAASVLCSAAVVNHDQPLTNTVHRSRLVAAPGDRTFRAYKLGERSGSMPLRIVQHELRGPGGFAYQRSVSNAFEVPVKKRL